MTQTTVTPDPLETMPIHHQEARSSAWWSNAVCKKGRDPLEKVEVSSALGEWLGLNAWEEDPEGKTPPGLSLMAWRGLWVAPRLTELERALDLGLCPPSSDALDWWSRSYFREKCLRSLFLPGYPAPTREEDKPTYEQSEELRRRVASKVVERWPAVMELYMNAPSMAQKKLYLHPLILAARPGSEGDFVRLLSWSGSRSYLGLEPLSPQPGFQPTEERGAPPSPVELLSLGLRRRFEPLIDMALAAGATVNDPVFDFSGAEQSLLHAAISMADAHMVDWILERQPNLEVWNRFARTPFLQAARMADVLTLEKLAKAGANRAATDRFGQTAAHLAVEGLSSTCFDRDLFRRTGQRDYKNKSYAEMIEAVERTAQALATIKTLGVDMEAVALPTPRNTKKNPSPFSGLARAVRQKNSAAAGETWEQQLDRRLAEDTGFALDTGPRLKDSLLRARLDTVIPPEPEDIDADGVSALPLPGPSRRPRF